LVKLDTQGEGIIKDNVYAHMWWNIAASQGDKDATKNRDMVAKEMTPSQIKKAKRLARECVKKTTRGAERNTPCIPSVILCKGHTDASQGFLEFGYPLKLTTKI